MTRIEFYDGDQKRVWESEIDNDKAKERVIKALKILAGIEENAVAEDTEELYEADKEAEMEELRETYLDFIEAAALYAANYGMTPHEVYEEAVKGKETVKRLLERALAN